MFTTKSKPHISSTQAYLDLAAIKDGVVILKSGGLRAILLVTSVNFALKSPQEQEDIVLRYQAFLNALHFPIQIVMQSRKLDLTEYLTGLKQKAEEEENGMVRQQISHYVDFMGRLISVANIMQKDFYVVIPYDPVGLATRGFVDRLLNPARQVTTSMTEGEFTKFKTELEERVNLIGSGLGSMGLRSKVLSTQQLIELFYSTYNPEEAVRERLTNAEMLATEYVGPKAGPDEPPESKPGELNG